MQQWPAVLPGNLCVHLQCGSGVMHLICCSTLVWYTMTSLDACLCEMPENHGTTPCFRSSVTVGCAQVAFMPTPHHHIQFLGLHKPSM